MSMFNRTHVVIGLLLATIAGLIGYQSFANRPAAAAPTPIATFDLERTFNSIYERQAAFDELPKLAKELEVKGEEQRKVLEQMRGELEFLVRGTPKHQELEERLQLATQEYRAYIEFCKLKIESERGRTLKKVYVSIRNAVRQIAESEGYALVLVNDSAAEIPPGTLEDLNRQISARRVIYSSNDITDHLIEEMNKAFVAAGGVVPSSMMPPAAKPAGRTP